MAGLEEIAPSSVGFDVWLVAVVTLAALRHSCFRGQCLVRPVSEEAQALLAAPACRFQFTRTLLCVMDRKSQSAQLDLSGADGAGATPLHMNSKV